MSVQAATARSVGHESRERLQAEIPATEIRLDLAGVSTAILTGGDGPPLVLLHGPGEFAEKWLRVFPQLAQTHQVIAPDLPGHGRSEVVSGTLDVKRMTAWLGELIRRTCATPPNLVGHVLGGAVALRYAIENGQHLHRMVLVDTLGLAPFRPSPRFALTMIGFLARPNERSFDRFMRHCSYDLDGLRNEMADLWQPFVDYNLAMTRSRATQNALRSLMPRLALPAIPHSDLARITVPTTLIWGREDRAIRLRVAEAASARYHWPLHVIDDCADDPPRDRPAEFVAVLRQALAG